MGIRGTDFVLNPLKLEKEFALVAVGEWKEYETDKKLGISYTVLLSKCQFEKLKVNIPDFHPIVSKEELEQRGQVPIMFEGLRTWASVYKGKLSVKAEAVKAIKAVPKQ